MASTGSAPATPLEVHLQARGGEETRELVQRVFPDFGLHMARPPDGLSMGVRHDLTGDDRFSYQRLKMIFGGAGVGSIEGFVVVAQMRAPSFEVRSGRTEVDTTRPFMSPDVGCFARWSIYDGELISVRREVVEAAARASTGDERHRLEFTGWNPISREAAMYWNSVRQHLAANLVEPAVLASPLLRGELLRTAARAMLVVFPNSTLGAESARSSTSDRVVQLATGWIEANAERDISLADIAQAAGAPARALAIRFRDQHGETPFQYLRRVRFERARAELWDADPWGSTTVAAVALRWGFTHAGRFAAEYRRRFGESPSATRNR